jgi:hypothetical protein
MIIHDSLEHTLNANDIDILFKQLTHIYTTCQNTTHIYEKDLEPSLKNAFEKIKNGVIKERLTALYPNTDITTADDMNEVYVTCIGANGSDKVFEIPHIDGPFYNVPYCTLLRCIVGVNGNKTIYTKFTLDDIEYNIQKYQYIAFDYNKDIHYIYTHDNVHDDSQRILLKIHYVLTPKIMDHVAYKNICSGINTVYNQVARDNFNKSKNPQTLQEYVRSSMINMYTFFYGKFEIHVGMANIITIILFLSIYELAKKKYMVYVVCFICVYVYVIYIIQFVFRTYPQYKFIRDALLFKVLSWGITLFIYLQYTVQPVSLILVVISLLFTYYCYLILGTKNTYFGNELHTSEEHVLKFPYGYIPHPMILGNIVLFSSMLLHPQFRKGPYGILPLLHIMFYVIVLLLEIYDVHIKKELSDIQNVYAEFKQYHQNTYNKLVHVGTTLLIYFAIFGMILSLTGKTRGASTITMIMIFIFFSTLYRYVVPFQDVYISSMFLIVVALLLVTQSTGSYGYHQNTMIIYTIIVIIALIIQSVSHILCKEDTYISQYKKDHMQKWFIHTVYLVPLVLMCFI